MDTDLPLYLAEIAKEKVGETPETRRRCIPLLRNSIQSHMKEFEEIYKAPDDKFLLRFLRLSKFNVTKAYDRIKSYYEARKTYKEDLEKTNLFEVLPFIDLRILNVTQEKTKDHETIFYASARSFKSKLLTCEQAYRAIMFCVEFLTENDEVVQIAGARIVVNCAGFDMRHLVRLTPSFLYKSVTSFLKIMPLKITAIHIINEHRLLQIPLKIVTSLLSPKLKGRLVFHGSDIQSLYDLIDPGILPSEIKGTGSDLDIELWIWKVLAEFYDDVTECLEKCYPYNNFDPDANYPDPCKNFPYHWMQKYYPILEEYQKSMT